MNKESFKFKLKGRTMVVIDWANVYGWFSKPDSKNYLGWKVDPKKLFKYLKSYSEITEINFYYGEEKNNLKSVAFKEEIQNIGYSHKSKDVKWVPASLETTAHFKVIIQKLFNVLRNIKNTNTDLSDRIYKLLQKIKELSISEKQLKEIYEAIEGLNKDLKNLNINIGELQERLKQPVLRRKCDFDVEISRDIYNNLPNFETIIIFSGDGDYSAVVEDIILKEKKVIVVFAPGYKGKEYENLKEGLFLCSVNKLKQYIVK